MSMYNVPTDGCNLEIMGYPFYAEKVSPNEAFRRREMNVNNVVGGTQIVTKGPYVGLDFSITTHVYVDPNRPDEYNSIFQEMMSKPVVVESPEIGGKFKAIVVIKPEHVSLNSLELTISIKEVPDRNSKIPGESFTVPSSKKITVNKKKKSAADKLGKTVVGTSKKASTKNKTSKKSKKNTISKKTKSKKNKNK